MLVDNGTKRTSRLGAAAPACTWRLALAAVLLLFVPDRASAWGRIGHRVAAKVAEARLTPNARAAVRALLESGESLADASTWADEVRRDLPETGPWHYVNVPISERGYDPKFCPPEGCVVKKIDDFRNVLLNPRAPRSEKQMALRFLVHFLQDMHQPLHVGERHDRGGNDIEAQFFGAGSNLHRVWDSGIIEYVSTNERYWLVELSMLATPANAALWSKGWVADWANESFTAAQRAYQPPGTAAPLQSGANLDLAYQQFALPIVRLRLAQAGTRLASVLNGIYP
jgi:hypothetical protein